MGPSVKFVSHIIDDQWFIFKIKGVNFFLDKRPGMGGGRVPRRVWQKAPFFPFFLASFPKLQIYISTMPFEFWLAVYEFQAKDWTAATNAKRTLNCTFEQIHKTYIKGSKCITLKVMLPNRTVLDLKGWRCNGQITGGLEHIKEITDALVRVQIKAVVLLRWGRWQAQ